jgi:hypothetical protein
MPGSRVLRVPHLVGLVAMMMTLATTIAIGGGTAPAAANHGDCWGTACNGDWPASEDCLPGYDLESRYFSSGNASIHTQGSGHCGSVNFARLQWDGCGYPCPPSKFQFKVERRERVFGSPDGGPPSWYWTVTHRQTRTVSDAWGGYYTRMTPHIFDQDGYGRRACARRAIYGSGGYGSYGSWYCTSWTGYVP